MSNRLTPSLHVWTTTKRPSRRAERVPPGVQNTVRRASRRHSEGPRRRRRRARPRVPRPRVQANLVGHEVGRNGPREPESPPDLGKRPQTLCTACTQSKNLLVQRNPRSDPLCTSVLLYVRRRKVHRGVGFGMPAPPETLRPRVPKPRYIGRRRGPGYNTHKRTNAPDLRLCCAPCTRSRRSAPSGPLDIALTCMFAENVRVQGRYSLRAPDPELRRLLPLVPPATRSPLRCDGHHMRRCLP